MFSVLWKVESRQLCNSKTNVESVLMECLRKFIEWTKTWNIIIIKMYIVIISKESFIVHRPTVHCIVGMTIRLLLEKRSIGCSLSVAGDHHFHRHNTDYNIVGQTWFREKINLTWWDRKRANVDGECAAVGLCKWYLHITVLICELHRINFVLCWMIIIYIFDSNILFLSEYNYVSCIKSILSTSVPTLDSGNFLASQSVVICQPETHTTVALS